MSAFGGSQSLLTSAAGTPDKMLRSFGDSTLIGVQPQPPRPVPQRMRRPHRRDTSCGCSSARKCPHEPPERPPKLAHSAYAGNWYESRIGQPEELSYAEKTAARGRRPSEPQLQVYPEVTGDTSRPVQGPRLRRFAEPNTWRTQTVDVAQSAAEPHVAAPTIARCRTAKQDMDAHLHEVCASAHSDDIFVPRALWGCES